MSQMKKLTDEQIQESLASLPQWELRNGKLHREFVFADFVTAFGFMASCATLAEQMNHHPEWFNVYKVVRVDLSTHDVGGISVLDVRMAEKMSSLAAGFAG